MNSSPPLSPLGSLGLLASFLSVPLLVLPWLNPFTSGPSAAVLPYLISWACASAALCVACALPQTDAQRVRTVAGAWVIAAGVSAVLGLLQYFDISHSWSPWVNQPGPGQAYGNLRQRNQFASLCSIGLAALCWWAQRSPHPQWSHRLHWPTAALAAVLGAAAAASASRTGLLQLVVLASLAACWAPARGVEPRRGLHPAHRVLAAALLAYGLAALVLPSLAHMPTSVFDRFHESSAQCQSRINLWRNMLYLIAQKPLGGWGWGELSYAHFMTLYDAPWAGLRFCDILDNAHNLPLHLAVELGLPVAGLFCVLVAVSVRRLAPWRERVPERQLAWAVLAVIGVHSLLEYPLWYGQFQIAALLCVWLLRSFPGAGAAQSAEDTAGAASAAPAAAAARWGWPAVLVAVAIASACVVAARSYWRVTQPYLPPTERAAEFRQQNWAQLRDIWLFSDQVDFAELAVTPLKPQTAPRLFALSTDLLHFSPEPMVVQKLLQSAQMLGKDEAVAFYAARFSAAFPLAYADWVRSP